MKNRQDYLSGKISHREFFAQFVDKKVKEELLKHISIEELKKSKDKHFNDISMKKWDGISGVIFAIINGKECLISRPQVRKELADKMKEAGEGISPAGLACVYKEAARQLVRPDSIV